VLRALAKPFSVPIFIKPHCSKTFCEPKLSNAACAKMGRFVSISRKMFRAFVAIPFPQNGLSIQKATSPRHLFQI